MRDSVKSIRRGLVRVTRNAGPLAMLRRLLGLPAKSYDVLVMGGSIMVRKDNDKTIDPDSYLGESIQVCDELLF